jgi:ADP-ribosylglycohydrolase
VKMKIKDEIADRRMGVMLGLAYGDALGRPTEFMKATALAKLGSPFQKRVGLNTPQQGIVTDDTQMSIAVAHAALGRYPADPKDLTERLVKFFIGWHDDPASFDGRRAPGATCTGAVKALRKNPRQWMLASRPDSKGNGANMRVAPLALRTDWTWNDLAGAAQLQAAVTHGHPTALAAAHLTAVAVRILLTGFASPGEELIDHLLAYAHDQRTKYHGDWLGHLWECQVLAGGPLKWGAGRLTGGPQGYIQRGWEEVIDALLSIYRMPRDKQQDPCEVGGGGWVAEQALACSLHTLLCFPGDPTNALRRAAFTDGDSDSIGSITGALAGAAYGARAFPSHWLGNLEYRSELESLAVLLDSAARR